MQELLHGPKPPKDLEIQATRISTPTHGIVGIRQCPVNPPMNPAVPISLQARNRRLVGMNAFQAPINILIPIKSRPNLHFKSISSRSPVSQGIWPPSSHPCFPFVAGPGKHIPSWQTTGRDQGPRPGSIAVKGRFRPFLFPPAWKTLRSPAECPPPSARYIRDGGMCSPGPLLSA